jgi:hypothetical protein
MEDFKSRKINTHRQSVTNSERAEQIKEPNSDKKKTKIIKKKRDDDFTPTTRVKDMKEIIERRYTEDLLSIKAPPVKAEEHKASECEPRKYSLANNEESKFNKTFEIDQPRIKRGSMRIFYMAKALEDHLHQKREDNIDINKEDHVVQIMMDKPSVNHSKKPSRIKLSL